MPSGSVGGCFGDGSPSRIGEPESWSEGFLSIVSYGALPRASEFAIRSKLRALGGRSIKIDCSAPGRVSNRLEDRLGFSKRLWSAPETSRRRCQILTGVPFPDLSFPTGVAFPDLGRAEGPPCRMYSNSATGSAPETPRRRCQILTGVPFPDLSIRLGALQIPTGVAFPELGRAAGPPCRMYSNTAAD